VPVNHLDALVPPAAVQQHEPIALGRFDEVERKLADVVECAVRVEAHPGRKQATLARHLVSSGF
jgi:hypothetical protein